MESLTNARLYGILDLGYVTAAEAPAMASRMLAGGVQVLQLRAKKATEGEIIELAKVVAPLCRTHGVPFILNDHPEMVEVTGADGAHVGQDDMTVARARELAGKKAIIGLSTHSVAQATAAQEQGPDYIGFGPLFATPTKPDYTPIGLEFIREVHQSIRVPIFCIGGVKLENLPTVRAAGAHRVVVVSGILQAPDVRAYCESLRQGLN